MLNIPFKSVLARFKNIENRNKKFNSLTKSQQRKEIAFDSLNLIAVEKKIKAAGEYSTFSTYWGVALESIKTKDAKSFQEKLVNDLPNTCTVCARGAMMLSQIRLGNSLDCNTPNVSSGTSRIIKGFTLEKFEQMEREYESCNYRHPYEDNTLEKLANICCNVIANGDFDKDDKTDYLKKWGISVR